MASNQTYYHYTSKESADAIMKEGKIRQSERSQNPSDAAYGDGVYLTKCPPTDGKKKLALNNYDGTKTFAKDQMGKLQIRLNGVS